VNLNPEPEMPQHFFWDIHSEDIYFSVFSPLTKAAASVKPLSASSLAMSAFTAATTRWVPLQFLLVSVVYPQLHVPIVIISLWLEGITLTHPWVIMGSGFILGTESQAQGGREGGSKSAESLRTFACTST